MSLSLLKTGALAATLVLALATGAFAKPNVLHGEMDDDSPLYAQHSQWSNDIGYANEGDEVIIYGFYKGKGGWFLVKDLDNGDHGWVRKNDVDVDWQKGPKGPKNGPGFCFGGPYGSFCVNP